MNHGSSSSPHWPHPRSSPRPPQRLLSPMVRRQRAKVAIAKSPLVILVDSKGITLYDFVKDKDQPTPELGPMASFLNKGKALRRHGLGRARAPSVGVGTDPA